MGFVNYVNTIRVNEAEQLLINSSKNIADIAFECGFESIRTFKRVFKEVKKKKPIELRKTEKGLDSVSYTHLDVYKRQPTIVFTSTISLILCIAVAISP